jgi:hypothetical protein
MLPHHSRWHLVRALARHLVARRRRILGAWYAAAAAAGAAARAGRRDAEVLAWRHLGEAVVVGTHPCGGECVCVSEW